ncbi:extracellular solute-binding protein [Corynebacterium timonense]|uniref:Iron(III) transport system substrate-binding protein n=1 Tax=Corynebacterium timonense TaxID=441500 RepID=A0A1H1SAN5_9CORY|nr:extracellular solute-binding protein [Corynebacterium timonense]SDS45024.1 iron(III) transport system substrate-binding protein [Corynebacterium timonense]
MRLGFAKTAASVLTVSLAAATLTACGSDPENEPLVIYSNSVSDGRGEWLQEEAAAAGFEIEFVDLGGADIQNRLIAEQANPIADVVYGLNNIYFENLKSSGVLQPYEPAWSSDVDPSMGDGETFWPIVREPIMLVYNDAAYTEETAPNDWPDLWEKEEYHGRYEVPRNLGGATTQLVISGILARHFDPNGELNVSDEGWDAIEQYFEYGVPAVEGQNLYGHMASGEVDMGQMYLAGKAAREEEYNLPTTAVQPPVGVPMATQQVGLVAGTDKPERAQEFIDWFGGAEFQAKWSNQFFTAPTNQAALEDADQDAVEQTEAFKEQDIDWTIVSENLPAWIERIELNYL